MTPWFPNPGDVQNGLFVQKQAQAAAKEQEVTICYYSSGTQFSKKETTVEGMPVIVLEFPMGSGISHQLSKRKHLRKCLNQLHQERPIDCLHGQQLTADALWFQQWADKKNIPTVYSIHWSGFTDSRFEQWPWIKKAIIKQLVKKASRILPVSAFLAGELKKRELLGNATILPNVVEVDPALIGNQDKYANFTFCMVADLDDSIKRITQAAQAFAVYSRTYPKDQFNIVGGGPDQERLTEYIGKFERINFLGRKSQPKAMEELSRCHVTLINSQVETFSIVALESLALGNTTIITPCGGPQETTVNTHTMVLKDFERPTLTEAMKEARKSYEIKGLPKPIELKAYSLETIGKSLSKVYNEVTIRE